MATNKMDEVTRHLRRIVLLRDGAGLTDGQLLEEYLGRRDEAALEALVKRHSPMVWGVCRRLLRHSHDAEDAFQATFLVLVRKAASIVPKALVGNWLYGVAHQTALNARATAIRQSKREKRMTDMPEPEAPQGNLWRELQPLLDQELSRLPDKYRATIVLCDLEGKTRKEAARQLGVPPGTVAGQLARARTMLAKRLARHGLGASGGALAAALSQNAATASVSPLVVSSTIKAVTLAAAGNVASGMISAKVVALTEGVVKAMLLTKLKIAGVLILLISFATYGVGVLARDAMASVQTAQAKEQLAKPKGDIKNQPNQVTEKSDQERLQGTWKLVDRKFMGEDFPGESLQLIFAKDRLEYQWETYFLEGTFKLEQSGTFKTLDMEAHGKTHVCLYRLEGDKLILATPNGFWGPRPKDLTSTKSDQSKMVLTFAPVPVQKALVDEEAVQQAKMKRARLQCGATLHRLVMAMHDYIDEHKHFPPPATIDPAGKPLLSWRVALLPYLGEKELYEQFRQDEPWDSVHNHKLMAKMPKIYATVGNSPKNNRETFYQVFVGEGCIFEEGKKIGIGDIQDGTVNTMAIIAAGEAVPWTKPADLACDPGKALPSLAGGMINDGFVSFAFADSSVWRTRNTIDEDILRPFILRSTGTIKDVKTLK
jgi:RNA polymerase sigma factor (sigma-70 family)